MKEIKLTQGQIALVDDEDYEKLNKSKWYAEKNGNGFRAARSIRIGYKKRGRVLMHREIMNALENILIDHKNGDQLDNQKNNLRFCRHQQNMFNRGAQKNNKLGIKGVHWVEKLKKFRAVIEVNDIKIHLGLFNVMGDADSAYRIAEEKYFGEFARAM